MCEKRLTNATEMTFVTIFFPPPWHCFVSQTDVAVAFAISEGYFEKFPERSWATLYINGHTALRWELSASMEREPVSGYQIDISDGLNYYTTLTGFDDGLYRATLALSLAQNNEQVGAAAETTFVVDAELAGAEGACIDFVPLEDKVQQLHFGYSKGGPWHWPGFYGRRLDASKVPKEGEDEGREGHGRGEQAVRELRNVALGARARCTTRFVSVFQTPPSQCPTESHLSLLRCC